LLILIILVTRLCISLALDSTFSYIDICFAFADELVFVVELVDLVELVDFVLELDELLLLNNLLLRLLLAARRFLALTREFLALLILICNHLPLIYL
jgi:hypothetical protein